MEPVRTASVVRRPVAAADTRHANGAHTPILDIDRAPIAQIGQAGKHFRILMRIEPYEVLMITLDEQGRPRRPSALSEPRRKVANTVMMRVA